MPICPKCKNEYREGFKKCSDCNVELGEDVETYKTESTKKLDQTEVEFVFLKSVSDGYESDIVISLLKSNDIEVFQKPTGEGEVLKVITGRSLYGIDLYVPKKQLKKANEILELFENSSKNDLSVED